MYKTDHRCVHIFGPNITTCGGAHDIFMSAPMGQKVLRSGYNPCSKIFRPLGELIERLLVSLIWKISKFVYTSFFNFVHGINLKNFGKRHWGTSQKLPILIGVGAFIKWNIIYFIFCYFWAPLGVLVRRLP